MPIDASVSVIIASNRHSPYLAEAIASVQRQTARVEEIILVDDGSPEPGLSAIAAEYGVRYMRQRHAGQAAAQNLASAAARGEWIAFLDDDDLWYPDKVARQVAALQDAPDAIACHSGLRIIGPDGDTLEVVAAPSGSTRDVLSGASGSPAINSLLVRRDEYIAIGGFDTTLRYAQDLDLILRLLLRGPFARADGPLMGYRKHPGQVTTNGFATRGGYVRVIRRTLRRVQVSGAREDAVALQEHLDRAVPATAEWGAQEMLARLRRGRLLDAARVGAWGLRTTRTAFGPAAVRVATRRLSGTRR